MAYGYNPSINYFNSNPYGQMMPNNGPIQPQQMQPMQLPQTGQMGAQTQPGTLYARYVAGREEAVAATVIPDGNLNLFVDEQHGMIYGKAVAPNGAAAFREFAYRQPVQQSAEPQQVQQWAPMEAVEQLRAEVRQLKDMFRERSEQE